MGAGKKLWGHYPTGDVWLPIVCDAAGQLVVDGAFGVSSGATFPVAPNTGDCFLHVVVGRKILYEYDGADWQPIISYGSMTVYVDFTDGTDDLLHGTGLNALAFKSPQFAANCIPGLYGGNVIIYINGETYYSDGTNPPLVIRGKRATGNFTITIEGETTTNDSGIATAGANTTLTDGTKAWGINVHANRVVKITGGMGAGQYAVIRSNTATILTIAGLWVTNPNNTSTYIIYTKNTSLLGSTIGAPAVIVTIYPAAYGVIQVQGCLDVRLTNLRSGYGYETAVRYTSSTGLLLGCYLANTNQFRNLYCLAGSTIELAANYIKPRNVWCIDMNNSELSVSSALRGAGNLLIGDAGIAGTLILMSMGSVGSFYYSTLSGGGGGGARYDGVSFYNGSSAYMALLYVENCNRGVMAQLTSSAQCDTFTWAGNNTNMLGVAASYGYVA